MKAKMVNVPRGKFCWSFKGDEVCDWLDVEYGPRPICKLKLWGLRKDRKGIRKSPDCMKLEELSKKAIENVVKRIGGKE